MSLDLLKSFSPKDSKDELTIADLQAFINEINDYVAGSILTSKSSLFYIELKSPEKIK